MLTTADTIRDAPRVRPAGGVAEVAALAAPAVLQTLSDTVMRVVDTAIVGRLGTTELAAVGFAGIWIWTILCGAFGAASGVQTFVAQRFGAGRLDRCGYWAWQGLYAVSPLALAWFVVAAVAVRPLFALLGPSAGLQAAALEYTYAFLLAAPAFVLAMTLTSFFRGIGDTRTPLVVAVVANVVNALATYGLVFGISFLPAWGVWGAGLATAMSEWLYALVLLAIFLGARHRRRFHTLPAAVDFSRVRRFLRTSVPIGGQWFLDMTAFALFTTIIARMGDVAMAANQAMIQLLSLSFMQAIGLSVAAGALVGRYVGAHDAAAAERSHHSSLFLTFCGTGVIAALFLLVPETLLGIFTTDREVLAIGRPLLLLGALFQIVDAVGIVCNGALRGSGDTRWPFVVQATMAWALRLPLAYLLAVHLAGGAFGAWIAELAYVGVLGTVLFLRFRGGAWRSLRI